MDQNLNPMTDVERDYYDWSVAHREKHGWQDAETAHVYTRSDNNKKIILFLSHSENFARWYSSRSSQFWCIRLKDGTECYYDEKATRILKHGKSFSTPGNWPMASYAIGGHPDDRIRMMKEASDKGVPTEFDREGDAVFTSPRHRQRYCKAMGYYDRNAGYRDQAPVNR